MAILVKILLVLLLLAIAGVVYVARLVALYIGLDILEIAWRLFRQGGTTDLRIEPKVAKIIFTDMPCCEQDPSSWAGLPSVPTWQSRTSPLSSRSPLEAKCCFLLT